MSYSRWIVSFLLWAAWTSALAAEDSASTLARILAGKGVLSASELAAVESAALDERVDRLAAILAQKGVLTKSDLARLARSPASAIDSERRIAPARYETAQARPAPQGKPETAPPVTAQSKFPITAYGTLLTNAFFNTSLTNIQDIPLFAGKQGSDPLGNDKNFGMTLRQSRFGLRYQGPRVRGAQVNGQFEFDLLGGKAGFGNGINMDLFRLRIAAGRLDWRNFSLEAGQDWSIFAPLNPTTLAEFAIPGLSASGNPWIRMPQLRAEFRHSYHDSSRLQLQVAAIDPNMGDYPGTFASGRTPGIGERGRAPGVESRFGLTTRARDREFSFGLSSHYARGKNSGTIGRLNVQTEVNSWGVALDYALPVTGKLALSGEAYEGRALGIFSVTAGQAIPPVGTPGQHGVEARGGWAQAQFNFNPKWQVNVAYGLELPNASELLTGDRSRNRTYVGNLIYKFSPHVTFAWEWRRFLTDFRNQRSANESGDHANMAVAYAF